MNNILTATKTVFIKRNYFISFLFLVPVVFLFFVLIQVWTIPGNSLSLQLSIFKMSDYVLTIVLSSLVSIFLVMQIFIFRNAYNVKTKLATAGGGGVGGSVGMLAAVLGTATCASCLIALFGFLGLGGIVFLLENQWYVVSAAIIILFILLYFSSRKVNGVCENCQVDKKPLK